ncbi:MAG: GNAT family N-acetyltransferase [Sphingobacteriales bacterium]
MKTITLTSFSDTQKENLLNIWNAEYAAKLQLPNLLEFEHFLDSLINQKHYLLVNEGDNIVGWAALFTIESAHCFFIMIDGNSHGKGYGTLLLNELKKHEKHLFGWAIDHNDDVKADGTFYRSPLDFYRKNGFTINSELRLETDQLSAVNIVWSATNNQHNL